MENGTEKNTQLLEKCRAEMAAMASLGEDILLNAVERAEKQTRACTAEWNQAQKTVALTASQRDSVAEARASGQEKLAAAAAEEEDARLAAETVQRMIEDANTLCSAANTDTARILQKAGDVLDETAKRAVSFYREKKMQREEVEAAICRLDATEKAVLYTMAKAERRASEKMLFKLIAERRQEVCAAEFENIRLEKRRDLLLEQREAENRLLEEVHAALQRATQLADDRMRAQAQTRDSAERELAAIEAETHALIAALEERIAAQELEKESAAARAEEAELLYAVCEEERESTLRQAERAARECVDATLTAQQAQEGAIREHEQRIAALRQESIARKDAYTEALNAREEAQAELDRLRLIVEQYRRKASDAAAEAQSAREAAQTAFRLAENATKIRESISNESSELLSHAQDVLMEAAAAAQQLMDEKDILRKSAEQECALVQERASEAEQALKQADQRVNDADAACEEMERQMVAEAAVLEESRQEWAAKTAAAIEAAQRAREQAEQAAEEKRQAAAEAAAELEAARAALQEIDETLRQLAAEKDSSALTGSTGCDAVRGRMEEELRQLAVEISAAEAEVERLQKERAERQGVIIGLNGEIEQTSDLLREMRAHVDEIIAVGVLDILSAEEVVGGCRYKEDAARRAAEEVVSCLGDYTLGTERFESLRAPDEPEAQADAPEEEPDEMEALMTGMLEQAGAMREAPAQPADDAAEDASLDVFAFAEAALEDVIAIPADETPAEADGMDAPAAEGETAESVDAPEEPEAEVEEPEESGESEAEIRAETEPAAESEERSEEDSEAAAGESEETAVAMADEAAPEEAAPAAEAAEAGERAPEPADEAVLPADDTEQEEELPDLLDYSGLTEEEIEYTQRLVALGDTLISQVFPTEPAPEPAPEQPAPSGDAYPNWMENLARSLSDDSEKAEAAASAPQPQAEAPVINSTPLLRDGLPEVQDAVVRVPESGDEDEDEDELRLSILNVMDEPPQAPPKKRRFPFF